MKRISLLLGVLALMAFQSGCPGIGGPWHSALYPANWTPGFHDSQGRFLHDFSYAGYHNGADPLPSPAPGATFDVTAYGADNTGATDATAQIQLAINAAEVAGGVVSFPAGLYRCDGVLVIDHSYVVLHGAGKDSTHLYFTKTDGMAYNAHIHFQGNVTRGSDVLLAQDGVNEAFDVLVADATGLSVGDDVSIGWVITDAFVDEHGMTGIWSAFNGQWQPFFRRKIVGINTGVSPIRITLDVPLRYVSKVRDGASLRKETGYIAECGIESLSIANAVDWNTAWSLNQVDAIRFTDTKDCWARNVASFESPFPGANGYHLQSGGLNIEQTKRFTVANCMLATAENRGGGGNGYLFQITRSNEVLTRDCTGKDGRHNFIQNWGFGTTGCVWLRCTSSRGTNMASKDIPIGLPAYCEFHHSLAMANLIDSCTLEDGWYGGNRRLESTGAGQTVTESVFWKTSGHGSLQSYQYAWGYVIGTTGVGVSTSLIDVFHAGGTAPEDYVEGRGSGATLEPSSLYEDQLAKRLGP